MAAGSFALAAAFGAVEGDVVVAEGVEQADGVGPAADAGHGGVWQVTDALLELLAGLVADDGLELPDHPGEGVGADHRADEVVGVVDGAGEVLEGGVDGVGEPLTPAGDLVDLGAHQAHPEDVHLLALDVFLAHVDLRVEIEQRARHRRRGAVLARAGLGDEALLAGLLRKHRLADGVVDLVGTAVQQVLPLEVDVRTPPLGEVGGVGQRRWPAGVLSERLPEFGLEAVAQRDPLEGLGQSGQRFLERFGYVSAPVLAECAGVLGLLAHVPPVGVPAHESTGGGDRSRVALLPPCSRSRRGCHRMNRALPMGRLASPVKRIEVSTAVHLPPAPVYDFLVDFPRYGAYADPLESIVQHGDGRAGTVYEVTVSWWLLTQTVRTRVTGLEPPDRIGWELLDLVDAHGAWELAPAPTAAPPDAETATEVTLAINYDPSSVGGDRLDLPGFVPLDAVVDRVGPALASEAEATVQRVVADLEGSPRPVDLAVSRPTSSD